MPQASRRAARLLSAFAILAAFAAALAGGATSAALADPQLNLEASTLQTFDQTGGAVMLELEGAPSAVVYADARKLGASKADAGKASKATKSANDQAQSSLLAAIDSSG